MNELQRQFHLRSMKYDYNKNERRVCAIKELVSTCICHLTLSHIHGSTSKASVEATATSSRGFIVTPELNICMTVRVLYRFDGWH